MMQRLALLPTLDVGKERRSPSQSYCFVSVVAFGKSLLYLRDGGSSVSQSAVLIVYLFWCDASDVMDTWELNDQSVCAILPPRKKGRGIRTSEEAVSTRQHGWLFGSACVMCLITSHLGLTLME